MEGIYRISGNAAHIELLKEMYAENRDIDIHSLDISVNGVAASLKKFFSDLLEPLIPSHLNQELVIADSTSIYTLSYLLLIVSSCNYSHLLSLSCRHPRKQLTTAGTERRDKEAATRQP